MNKKCTTTTTTTRIIKISEKNGFEMITEKKTPVKIVVVDSKLCKRTIIG